MLFEKSNFHEENTQDLQLFLRVRINVLGQTEEGNLHKIVKSNVYVYLQFKIMHSFL